MGLLDALLLDPYRINVWISATRTDGAAGSGTQNDPYDGSTAAKFDAIMNSIPASPPSRVHLGPGMFQTGGYGEGLIGGWQPKPGMKIVGSGIDVTTLKLAGSAVSASFYAVGHALSVSGLQKLMDYFEISDLTIDCNLRAGRFVCAAGPGDDLSGRHAVYREADLHWWAFEGI